jgi:hypothetical protein
MRGPGKQRTAHMHPQEVFCGPQPLTHTPLVAGASVFTGPFLLGISPPCLPQLTVSSKTLGRPPSMHKRKLGTWALSLWGRVRLQLMPSLERRGFGGVRMTVNGVA